MVLVSGGGGGGGIVAFGLFGHQRGRPLILLVVIVITCVRALMCVCGTLCARLSARGGTKARASSGWI